MRSSYVLAGAMTLLVAVPAAWGQERSLSIEGDWPNGPRIIHLFEGSDAARAALGITTRSGGMRDTLGLLIVGITTDGPADKAGLQEGDRIASINGVSLKVAPADAGQPDMAGLMTRRLMRQLSKVKPGDEVELNVYSGGRYRTVKVKTADREALTPRRSVRASRDAWADRAVIGLGLGGGPSKRDTLGLLVTSVASDGPAEKAGIEEGDRIAAVNGIDLRVSPDEAAEGDVVEAKQRRFMREMSKVKVGDTVELEVYANGTRKTVKVTAARFGDVYPRDRFRGFGFDIREDALAPIPPVPPIPPIPAFPELRVELGDELPAAMARLRAEMSRLHSLQNEVEERARAATVQAAALQAARARAAARSARIEPALLRWAPPGGPSGSTRGRGTLVITGSGVGRLSVAGLELTTVGEDLASYFGPGATNGLLVLEATAPWRDLKAGDVILSVNGRPVRDGDRFSISLDRSEDTRFELLRKGKRQVVTVKAR